MWSRTTISTVCNLSRQDEANLWHRRLSHIGLKTIHKTMSNNVITMLLSLISSSGNVCGDFQSGKQTHASHK